MRCRANARIFYDRGGAAGLEFALIGPVMLILMLGTIELTNAIRVQAKLDYAAGQLAELVAGQAAVTEGSAGGPGGTLGDLCTAVSYNMLPYAPSALSAHIQSITGVQNGQTVQAAQAWANDRSCPTANPGTSQASSGTQALGYPAIAVQLTYAYSNLLTFMLGQTITFTAVGVARPRSNTTVSCSYPSGNTSASCPVSS